MTPRENLLSLYRRQGYEFAPVELGLCPALQAKMEAAIGKGVSPADHFGYVKGFARIGMPKPKRILRAEPDWRTFFTEPLNEKTNFNDYGVAMEGGHEGVFHLWRMHHPLAGSESLDQLQSYPWPE